MGRPVNELNKFDWLGGSHGCVRKVGYSEAVILTLSQILQRVGKKQHRLMLFGNTGPDGRRGAVLWEDPTGRDPWASIRSGRQKPGFSTKPGFYEPGFDERCVSTHSISARATSDLLPDQVVATSPVESINSTLLESEPMASGLFRTM